MENLHDKRKIYNKSGLLESDVAASPFQQFRRWFAEADGCDEIAEPNAMAVSTAEPDGCPRTRMVLLKSYDEEGFVFYTNFSSRKGKSLEKLPKACLSFFWPPLERQVIIKANIKKVPREVANEYFQSRPRGSRLGAIASPQSEKIPNREFLEKQLENAGQKFEGKEVDMPEDWGGYLAIAYEAEFWQGRPNRLHDRILYEKSDTGLWVVSRLAP